MKSISLTIAIPTWNRNSQLAITIESLNRQLRDGVRILVLDNCSTVPISKTLPEELRSKITIVRNIINIGACANVLRCFELADSDWVWILGDDDQPAADAITRILLKIQQHPDCFLIDFGHPYMPPREKTLTVRGAVNAISGMYYPDGNPQIYSWSDGHISNEVINRRKLKDYIQIGYKFIHSHYPHVAMFFTALSNDGACHLTGPHLAHLRVHTEAPKSYSCSDISKGWRILGETLADPKAKASFLYALDSSIQYGTASRPKGLTGIYRTLVPERTRICLSRLKKFVQTSKTPRAPL